MPKPKTTNADENFNGVFHDTFVRAAKPPADKRKKKFSEDGLQLLVHRSGVKSWVFVWPGGEITIGQYPEWSIDDARDMRSKYRRAIKDGRDPRQEKRDAKAAAQESGEQMRTGDDPFKMFAAAYLDALKNQVAVGTYAQSTWEREEDNVNDLNKAIGLVKLKEMTVNRMLPVLNKFENLGQYEKRQRMFSTARSVCEFGREENAITVNPLAGAKFKNRYTSPDDVAENYAALVDRENNRPAPRFSQVLRDIAAHESRNDFVQKALVLLNLTLARPGDVKDAMWPHFHNLWSDDPDEKPRWVIPFEHLKARTMRKKRKADGDREGHTVMLSRQAVLFLRDLHTLSGGGDYLFPGRGDAKTISENSLNQALRAMGYDTEKDHTAHGFRTVFSTTMNGLRVEVTDSEGNKRKVRKYEWQIVEMCLDHKSKEVVRFAYDRGKCLDDRLEIVQHWANICDKLRDGGKVMPLKRVA